MNNLLCDILLCQYMFLSNVLSVASFQSIGMVRWLKDVDNVYTCITLWMFNCLSFLFLIIFIFN